MDYEITRIGKEVRQKPRDLSTEALAKADGKPWVVPQVILQSM